MKTTIFTFLTAFFCFYGQSQVTYSSSEEMDYFEILESTNNFIYSYTKVKGEYYMSELIIYNHAGEKLNTMRVDDKKGQDLMYVGESGGKTVFAISNGQYIVVDENGKELSRQSFEGEDKVKEEKMLFHENGYVVIQQVKVKKVGVGLRIKGFDKDFNELWANEKFPEKGRYRFQEAAMKKDGNFAFLYERGTDKGIALMSSTGEEIAFNVFETKEEKMKTYDFFEGPDGHWNLIAHYGNSKDGQTGMDATMVEGNPLGAAILKFDGTTGEFLSEVTIDYVTLQAQYGDLKPDGTPVYTANAPLLQFLDVVNIKGKDYYICESILMGKRTVQDNSSGTPVSRVFTQMILQDYYLLDYSDPLAAPKRIWKPERTVEIKLSSSTEVQTRSRKEMANNRFYSYQGMFDGKIVSRGYAQMHNYYTLIDPELGEDITQRVFWSRPLNAEPSAFPPRSTYFATSGNGFGRQYMTREGLLETGSDFMLYAYDSRSNLLQMSKINF